MWYRANKITSNKLLYLIYLKGPSQQVLYYIGNTSALRHCCVVQGLVIC